MIEALKFISIPVKDYDRALKFYTEKLGFQLLLDTPFDKGRWIELKIPDAETEVVLFTPPGQEDRAGGFMNCAWTTTSVQRTYEEYRERGVEFEGPPQRTPWGFMAIFKDSEGNSHCLSQDSRLR